MKNDLYLSVGKGKYIDKKYNLFGNKNTIEYILSIINKKEKNIPNIQYPFYIHDDLLNNRSILIQCKYKNIDKKYKKYKNKIIKHAEEINCYKNKYSCDLGYTHILIMSIMSTFSYINMNLLTCYGFYKNKKIYQITEKYKIYKGVYDDIINFQIIHQLKLLDFLNINLNTIKIAQKKYKGTEDYIAYIFNEKIYFFPNTNILYTIYNYSNATRKNFINIENYKEISNIDFFIKKYKLNFKIFMQNIDLKYSILPPGKSYKIIGYDSF